MQRGAWWRYVRVSLLAAGGWAIAAGSAFAQASGGESKGGAGLWTMSYALVFLGIVLGLLILLRPSGRSDQAKKDQFDE